MKENGSPLLFPFRSLYLAMLGLLGWYFIAGFRTCIWGYEDILFHLRASLIMFCIFVLPLAFLPLIGVSWRRKLAAISTLACICVPAVEGFALGQEHLVIQRASVAPGEGRMEQRWWPFQNHSLSYKDGQGQGYD